MNKIPETGITFDAEVTRVIDGDTIEVETKVRHRIRLQDCWCAETRLGRNTTPADKVRGLDAKAYLQNLLAECRNRVRVVIPGNGGNLSKLTTLGRAIGKVWRRNSDDVESLSEVMVAAGHATAERPD